MTLHAALLALRVGLGYQEIEGLCHGFALRWLEATLLGDSERARFERRMELIKRTPRDRLLAEIKQAQAKKGQGLTEKDYELLDIMAFFDSLELFHLP
ncbi:hypothetical protein ACNVED_08235 [Legionella sp. D16C41]|uniref:hypothetical protein n=1 Tax=Legionella sp. D16C41 TaxID=3402688 RepID=UPI003AF694FB